MRSRLPTLALALALLASLVATPGAPASAGDDDTVVSDSTSALIERSFAESLSGAWFIELASAPATKGTARSALARERDAVRSAMSRGGIQYSERFAYEWVWNGLSVNMSPSDAVLAARLPGVRAVYPVLNVSMPTTTASNDPELWTALLQTGADVAQASGFTGAGVKVGIIDTGIDYDNPDLGGCFGAGCRVFTGHDFVGDAYNASGSTARQTTPRPDPDPDDCAGHGTHVSGIVGANGDPATGGVRGVAPGVLFGAYRVFGCEGSTSTDIMAAAMDRAYADGMQVVNMSIGSSFQWPSYPSAVAADNLVDSGVVVVASIGNSGSSGVYSAGAPGVGEKVIGVGSFDNTHLAALTVKANPGGAVVAYTVLSSADEPPTTGTSAEIVYVGRGCVAGTGVPVGGDPYLADPKDKVALIDRGVCTFNEKYARAFAAGAVGVIVANNAPGIFLGGSVTNLGIFGIAISKEDGTLLRGLTAPVTATWTDQRISAALPTANQLSSFTSYGLVPDLSLKPDIAAPGGFIYSTLPLEQGGHGVLSGTSMASPHVAGAVAAYLGAHPGTAAGDVRTILQNSADPKPFPGTTFLDLVHRQGAGMVDIRGAINAKTLVTPGKIALGERAASEAVAKRISITNNSADAVTYTLSHEPALATRNGTTFAPIVTTTAATVAFASSSIVVPAGTTADVDVTITAPTGTTANLQFGGYLKVSGAGAAYRVPYAGFRGDYQSLVAMTPTTNNLPWLAKRTGVGVDPNAPIRDYAKQGTGATFTFKTKTLDDVPYILFHLDQQVSRLTIDVYQAGASTPWGRVVDQTDFGRSSTSTSFFSVSWSGKAADPNGGPSARVVKDGSYFFKITILKALGDPNNPAHLETWNSPVFNVLREGDETAPTSVDVRVATNTGAASQLDSGDSFKIVFSELMLAPTAGSSIGVQDDDGTQADIVCGTNATCFLNSVDETVGGTSYGSGRVLTVTATAAVTGTGGTTAGLQLPATIVSTTLTDRALNPWDLANSADRVIDTE